MNLEQLPAISVIKPVSSALEEVKSILFKPFDINKWFTIGFCAWLEFLGQRGLNFHFNLPPGNLHNSGSPLGQIQNVFSKHLLLITVIGSIGLLIGLAIMITLLWLSSRGRFMFLYGIVENKAEVKIPWHKFRQLANNLFLFKLVSGFIAFICLAVCTAVTIMMIVLLARGNSNINIVGIFVVVCLSLITALIAIVTALFFKFTNDFTMPIMYLRFCSCTQAWSQFLQILLSRKAAFALYLLFQIVITMVIAAIMIALVLGTCCCAAIFLMIPYISTVLILPLLVFKRAYSLYYLRQFGPSFDVFATAVTLPESD